MSGPALTAFLSSLQLADSLFPSGMFTASHGLEAFVQEGFLAPEGVRSLLADYVRHGVGPADGVALACAHRAGDGGDAALARAADARLTAVKLPREAREMSQRMGRQLLETSDWVFGEDAWAGFAAAVRAERTTGNHAVVLGLLMARLGIARVEAVAGELYAFAASAVAALVRMATIDPWFAQSVLHALRDDIAATAPVCAHGDVDDIASATPFIDVMGMRHESAALRLFMS